ncbi:MAG: molybdate ABC transporter substrate-binding protein [Firmicutes bacterium]|nr:molybdate ABC transporter substrate-binding protein [Bacillota bacterium]
MKKIISIITVLSLALCMFMFTGCGSTEQTEEAASPEITVMAAASLTDALDEIIAGYQKDSDVTVLPNYAGSGDLVQQIEGGAPCDIFISASKGNMDQLEEEELINSDSRKDLLTNRLTLVASTEKADVVTMDTLTSDDVTGISIGEIETVPAGKYASQVFDNMGITEDVNDKLIYAKDVRAVLNYVATGEVDCGFVYRTDAELEKDNLAIICDVDESLHNPIVYPSAIMAEATDAESAADFYEYLSSDFAKETFTKYGFTVK